MEKHAKELRLLLLVALLVFCYSNTLKASSSSERTSNPVDGEILIVTSYTSDTKYIYDGINNFIETYNNLGGTLPVVVENMNVFNLKGMFYWPQRLYEIRCKHPQAKLMLLLGGEAWTAYLSKEYETKDHTDLPVICSRASRHGVMLPPNDSIDLKTFSPHSIDLIDRMRRRTNVAACYAYQYDMDKTVELIKRLYPQTNHIAFLSDNTYNGLIQWALVNDYMQASPELEVTMIDGRKLSLDQAVDTLKEIPANTAILVGIWRIDSNDMAYINNSVYAFTHVVPSVPAFSLTSSSIGYWSVGGYVPLYDDLAGRVGKKAYEIIHSGHQVKPEYYVLPMHYLFDYNKLEELKVSANELPEHSDFLNRPLSFFEVYSIELKILLFVVISLLLGTIVSFSFYIKTKKLKNNLLESNRQLMEDKHLLQASESKLRQSEAELRIAKDNAEEARKRAEDANQMKSAFVANMSHEIRTPLNAIVGFSCVLVDMYAGEDKEQQEFVNIIRKNSDALLRLVDDVLDVARLESEHPSFYMEDCDVIALGRGVVDSLRLAPAAQQLMVSFESEYDSCMVYTDSQRLQQILKNLLYNSFKFTSEGGRVTLSVEKDDEHGMLVFSVTDTGCGIPQGMHERIFERFTKVDDFVQGTGLGLTICRMVIRHLGGDIWVDPDYNNGARLIFTHPMK
ncbi:sensor histidine kinase [Bacteroides timonensis]|uniref:sensor histidine kinase n=1 Tax=Bacteroides timonensis TaxID=1470345 RepID=UPI0004B8325D|nr:HAMP domain-containing sensor histidine kinase [Bacteroides timonensis]